jgi:hypothetical protein
LLFLVIAMVLLLVAYGVLDVWAGYRLRAQIARHETRYGSLNEDTLLLRPVQAEDNRARVVKAAAALIVREADIAKINGFVSRDPSFPVPVELRAFVEANRSATNLAAEIRTRSQSNWEIEPRNVDTQPDLLEIRTLSNALYAAALLEIEAGRADEALKVVMSGLTVAASLRQEWMLLPQLVRIAIGVVHLEAVEEVVVRSEPSTTALEELARCLRESREPNPMQNGLVGEMKFANGVFETLETGGRRNLDALPSNGLFWTRAPARFFGRPFIRLARARFLKEIERLLDVQSGPRPRPPSAGHANSAFWDVTGRLGELFIPGLERAIETSDMFMSALSATEIGVALRRHRLDHGSYPDDLSALAPAYLATVPIDPFTGKPPVYLRQGAGFTLHAEGGKGKAPVKSALDWKVEK